MKKPAPSPAARYLALACRSLSGIRRDLPALASLGEAMAQPILRGGSVPK